MMCLKSKVYLGLFSIATWSFPKQEIMAYGSFQIWDLSIPSASKLSENHKIVEFGPLELKLQS